MRLAHQYQVQVVSKPTYSTHKTRVGATDRLQRFGQRHRLVQFNRNNGTKSLFLGRTGTSLLPNILGGTCLSFELIIGKASTSIRSECGVGSLHDQLAVRFSRSWTDAQDGLFKFA